MVFGTWRGWLGACLLAKFVGRAVAVSFATQLEVAFCLATVHSDEAAAVTEAQLKVALVNVMGTSVANTFASTDPSSSCGDSSWAMRVSVYNAANAAGSASAADVAGNQTDAICGDEALFLSNIAAELAGDAAAPSGSDFTLGSVGFVVLWLEGLTVLGESPSSSGNGNVVSILGVEVFWPKWLWGIYAAMVLVCVLPLALWLFRARDEADAIRERRSPDKRGIMAQRKASRKLVTADEDYENPAAIADQQNPMHHRSPRPQQQVEE